MHIEIINKGGYKFQLTMLYGEGMTIKWHEL